MADSEPDIPTGAADGNRVPPPYAVTRRAADDGAVVVVLEGELDLAAVPALRSEIDRSVDERTPLVVLDLDPTQFMDSSILRELVMAHGRLGSSGARLVLARPSLPVRRLFELTRATDLLVVAATLEAALAPPAGG